MSNIVLPSGKGIVATDSNTGEGLPVDARQSVQYYKDIANLAAPYINCQVIVREDDSTDLQHPKGIYVITKLTELGNVDTSGIKTLKETVNVTKEDIGLGNVDNVKQVPQTRTINSKLLSSDIILNANDVGAIPTSQKGANNGVAELDSSGKLKSTQIPSEVATNTGLGTKVDKVSGAEGKLPKFNSSGNLEDSGFSIPTTEDSDQILGYDSTLPGKLKWINKPINGQNGDSAYQIWLNNNQHQSTDPGYSETDFLNSLKAHIGNFHYENTDADVVSDITDIGDSVPGINNLVPGDGNNGTDDTLDVIVLMNNGDTTTPKTMMFSTSGDSTNGYKFYYVGDLQSAMSSNVLTQTNIVNDWTTGGAYNVLSAEQGKNMGAELYGGNVFVDVNAVLDSAIFYKYYDSDNTINKDSTNASQYTSVRIPCNQGEKFRIFGQTCASTSDPGGSNYTTLWVFSDDTEVDGEYSVISASPKFTSYREGVEITAPVGSAYLTICFYNYDSNLDKIQKEQNIPEGLTHKVVFATNETPSQLFIIDDDLEDGASNHIPTTKQTKALNDKITPISNALTVNEFYSFKASQESKLLLDEDITLSTNGDSLEFKVVNFNATGDSGFSFISRNEFNSAGVGIIGDSGRLWVNGIAPGASSYSWVIRDDSDIGDVRNKDVKLVYEDNKIKVYVDDTLKKTIDSQPTIVIRAFGKTGNYSYITFDLQVFKINGVDYDIISHASQNNNVVKTAAVDGMMTEEQVKQLNSLTRKIKIEKETNSLFYVNIPMPNGNYAKHRFEYVYRQNTLQYTDNNSDVHTVENVVTADVWNPDVIYIKSSTNVDYSFQGNLNFIYLIKDNETGFENETQHVGSLHGCEIKDFQKFYVDGKEIEPWNLTEPVYCDEFRVVLKAYTYANDSTQTHPSGVSLPKLDSNGDMILTAIHTYDATYFIDNTIKFTNNLKICRNGVRFSQLHGSMLQGWYSGQTDNVLLEDENFDCNDYVYIYNSEQSRYEAAVTVIGDSEDLNPNKVKKAQCAVITLNDECQVWQTMDNIDDNTEQYIRCMFYQVTSEIDRRLKLYFEPCKTEYNGNNQSKVFNDGDNIRVVVERRIVCK